MTGQPDPSGPDAFAASRERFDVVVAWLEGVEARGLDHAEVEKRLDVDGRQLLRQLYQDHLDLRARNETRLETVIGADGVPRAAVETGHTRALTTVFGEVRVERPAYRRRGHANLYPADGELNLPAERHSHGLRRLAAVEAARGSFDDTVAALGRATGQRLGKRQVEDLASRAAADFEDFYATRRSPRSASADLLVLSADGKGVVMRPNALRPATGKAAAKAKPKLATRLSKGEKRNRKRMAEVGAVYDAAPIVRTPDDILPGTDAQRRAARAGPQATNKWLTASVVEDAACVVSRIFDEAARRDPDHQRTWVALVDGNNHQIDRIHAEATARRVDVAIVCDFVHVLEYLWKAAWSFHRVGRPGRRGMGAPPGPGLLAGKATTVAGVIRRKATTLGLDRARRKGADEAAAYLTNKARYLDYPTALQRGWSLATGVIEGACRHLVKDRMDITGARWPPRSRGRLETTRATSQR